MAYVAVKGGERAIDNAHAYLDEVRRGDTSVAELSIEQIREQMSLAVDRVMAEGSCYDRDLAALAIKQAMGDMHEAIFLLRAYRTTLPRFGYCAPLDTTAMAVRRRVSAAFKDLPGGQVLGPTFDYTHRLLNFKLAAEGAEPVDVASSDEPMPDMVPTIRDAMASEEILETPPGAPTDDAQPYDLTRRPTVLPAGRDQRLQALARGDEGFLTCLAYSAERGFGGVHPLCGEVRMGEVTVEFEPEELGFPIEIAEIQVTECQMISPGYNDADQPPELSLGYGLVFGHAERKAMAMATVDGSLRGPDHGEDVQHAVEDEEFVLYHCDSLDASGFLQHLKLPHYVDFQAQLQVLRKQRAKWNAKKAEQVKEAAETETANAGSGELVDK
ncbi:MAG: carbon-phosphorus lyase complex subunit PhnI [Pseudomonadota bacterium]